MRRNARHARALEAAKRLGMDDTTIAALAQCLRPLTPAEQQEYHDIRARNEHLAAQKRALDLEWKNMSFAEWSARRAAGTLPAVK